MLGITQGHYLKVKTSCFIWRSEQPAVWMPSVFTVFLVALMVDDGQLNLRAVFKDAQTAQSAQCECAWWNYRSLYIRQTILCNVSNPLCWLKCRSATLTSFAKQFVFISQQPIISAFEDRLTILCVTRKSPVLKEKLPFYYFVTSPASHSFEDHSVW